MIVTREKALLHQAILKAYPGANFSVDATTFVITYWQCPNFPNPPSIDVVKALYRSHTANTSHTHARAGAYPKIADQLDAIMKGMAALSSSQSLPQETLDWIKACQQVKSDYPKPPTAIVPTLAPIPVTVVTTAEPTPIQTPAPTPVNVIPVWSTTSIPSGTLGTSYQAQLIATDPNGGAITYTLLMGQTLPPSLTLNTDGLLSGTLNAIGTYMFQVNAASTVGSSVQTFNLVVQ